MTLAATIKHKAPSSPTVAACTFLSTQIQFIAQNLQTRSCHAVAAWIWTMNVHHSQQLPQKMPILWLVDMSMLQFCLMPMPMLHPVVFHISPALYWLPPYTQQYAYKCVFSGTAAKNTGLFGNFPQMADPPPPLGNFNLVYRFCWSCWQILGESKGGFRATDVYVG